jgi:hypothetical protein
MPRYRARPNFRSVQDIEDHLTKWGKERGVFDEKLIRLYHSLDQLVATAKNFETRLHTFRKGFPCHESKVRNRKEILRRRQVRAAQARTRYHEAKKTK